MVSKRVRSFVSLLGLGAAVTFWACMPPHETWDLNAPAPERAGGSTGSASSGGSSGTSSGGASGSNATGGAQGASSSSGGAQGASSSGTGGSTNASTGGSSGSANGGASGGGTGGASGGGADAGGMMNAGSGPAASFKKQCFYPVMTGWSPDEFCEAYGEICTFGGAQRYKDLADCKAKFKGFASDADGCKAGHLCRAFKEPGMKEADCASSSGAVACRN